MLIATIIYYPNALVINNIINILGFGQRILIFDNSPLSIESQRLCEAVRSNPNLLYYSSSKNIGISKALNHILSVAHDSNVKKVLYIDQDTIVTVKSINYIYNSFNAWELLFDTHYALVNFSNKVTFTSCSLVNTTLAISSGSLLNVSKLLSIGAYNTKYFADLCDYEICFRAIDNNLMVANCFNCPGFDHITNQPDIQIKFFGKLFLLRCYSPFRIISTISSHFYLLKTYFFSNQRFSWLIFKSLIIYSFFQFIARIFLLPKSIR